MIKQSYVNNNKFKIIKMKITLSINYKRVRNCLHILCFPFLFCAHDSYRYVYESDTPLIYFIHLLLKNKYIRVLESCNVTY